MTKIALIRVADYDEAQLEFGLASAFEALGVAKLFSVGENILIKPNLLSPATPDRAVTPHPVVFDALIKQLSGFKVRLSYGDSPAMASPKSAARAAGLSEVADRWAIPLADFTKGQDIVLTEGLRLRNTMIANGVLEAAGLVNLCKLKTHALTGMTGAIKNLFGVIVGPRKAQLHVEYPDAFSFTKMLAELNHLIKPRLIVMDAIVAMEGNGPASGTPRQVGWIIVGTDPVAIDTVGASIMGFQIRDLPVITAAVAAGLGTADLKAIDAVVIETARQTVAPFAPVDTLLPELVVANFVRPHVANSLMTKMTQLGGPVLKRYILKRPAIIDSSCTRCGQCVSACPVNPKALDQPDPVAVPSFKYERCIRCYCCQEICPSGAIAVEKSALGRLAGRLSGTQQ
jgi:uncharacterized protein (DUF362 family)/ferredoxin